MQALLESALHAPPPSTLLHAAAPPSPLPVLLVSTTLVLQQSPALDASPLLEVLQSPTALHAAQITRIFALLAQLVLVILLALPPYAPLRPLSPAVTGVHQVLPHAINATQHWLQLLFLLLLQHAQPLE